MSEQNNKDQDLAKLEAEIADLEPAEVLGKIEHLAGMDRLNAILTSTRAEEVVQITPFEDLYFLVKDLGDQDALPVLELASSEQVKGLFDLEVWHKDNLQFPQCRKWFALLMEMDEDRFLYHIIKMDRILLIAFFKNYVQVIKRDETFDPIDSRKLLFATPDQRYYLEMLKSEKQCRLIAQILMRIAKHDDEFFTELLEGIYWEHASELEEEAYQNKIRRMADKGFPDYFESLDIMQVRQPDKLKLVRREFSIVSAIDKDAPPPIFPVLLSDHEDLLQRTLSRLPDEEVAEIRWEMAYVANRYLVAKQVGFERVENVRDAIEKMQGLLNLGLEYTSSHDEKKAAKHLSAYYIRNFFILGHSLVQTLSREAGKLSRSLGDTWDTEGSALLDSPYQEFLERLSDDEPRLFQGVITKEDVTTQTITTLKDYRTAQHLLLRLKLFADVFNMLLKDGKRPSLEGTNIAGADELKLSCLFVTGMAHYALDGEFKMTPLPESRLEEFVTRAILKSGDGWQFDPALSEAFALSLSDLEKQLGEGSLLQLRPFFDDFLEAAASELGMMHESGSLLPMLTRSVLVKLSR